MIGTTIGPYRVVRKLGAGGMGSVFEAVHVTIERRVSIKVLHPEYAKNAEFAQRFFNEARAVNRADHPGLVQISDYGQLPDGTAYIVMELVKGETLGKRLTQLGGSMPVYDVLRIGLQIADSLAAAHAKNIVHRDIKPENVMIIADPQVPGGERTKLLDFGIAKLDTSKDVAQLKTKTNTIMGTPIYMSPEQCRGSGGVDDRSDVYSLGVLFYNMLAGQPPFNGEGMGEILGKHMYEAPPPLDKLVLQLPPRLVALIHSMLHKDRYARPAMRHVVVELEALLEQQPRQPKKRSQTAITPLSDSEPPRAETERQPEHGHSHSHNPTVPAPTNLVTSDPTPPPRPAAPRGESSSNPNPGVRPAAVEAPRSGLQRPWTRTDAPLIKQAMDAVLVVDPDFDAFCMDHFPQVYRLFSAGMERSAKESLLLSSANLDTLVASLRRIEPEILPTLPPSSAPAHPTPVGQRTVQPPRAPFDRNWYVGRPEEEEQAVEALDYHKPVVFFGPELYGKTWLLNHSLEYAREHDYRIASINLNIIDKAAREELGPFLHKFALRLCKELQLDAQEVDTAFKNPRTGPIEALNDVMCWTVLPAISERLVLAIDNVDLIAEKSYQDEYFGMLRAWADSGGPFERLHLILCISTAPALLVNDVHRSPFNLGDVIQVPELNGEQLAFLARLHGLSCTGSELTGLQDQVGGHPYLARLALYEAYRRRTDLKTLLERLHSDPRGGVFAGYLDHLRRHLQAQPGLLEAFRRLTLSAAAGIEPALSRRLERAGLIVLENPGGSSESYRVRYRLYQRLAQG